MERLLDPFSLRLFVAVCEEGNIARAAAREAIVASAVSKRITALEDAVGMPLLSRARRGVTPTAAGEVMLREARELLQSMARLHAEIGAFAGGVHGSVRVVAAPSVLAEQLPADIGRFVEAHPLLRVSLDERPSVDIVRMVREGTADLGVLWDITDLQGLDTLPYRSDRLCVAVRQDDPLAGRATVTLAEALPRLAVGVAPGGRMDLLLRKAAAALGSMLVYRVQVSALDAAARIVAAGLGPAVLPREAVLALEDELGLSLVPLSEPWAHRHFMLCVRPSAAATSAVCLLMKHLHETASLPSAA
jgi:DNA-binding transcriptional LysR family regulator